MVLLYDVSFQCCRRNCCNATRRQTNINKEAAKKRVSLGTWIWVPQKTCAKFVDNLSCKRQSPRLSWQHSAWQHLEAKRFKMPSSLHSFFLVGCARCATQAKHSNISNNLILTKLNNPEFVGVRKTRIGSAVSSDWAMRQKLPEASCPIWEHERSDRSWSNLP